MRILFYLSVILFLASSCGIVKGKRYSNYKKDVSVKTHELLKDLTTEYVINNNIDIDSISEEKKIPIAQADTPTCDIITMTDGTEISANVKEITPEHVKYLECNSPSPIYSVMRENVFMIKYSNGRKEVITSKSKSDNNPKPSQDTSTKPNTEKTMNGWSIAGFVAGVLGFGPLAIIFSSIALNQIKKQPDKYTGKGLAVAGLVLGVLFTLILLALL